MLSRILVLLFFLSVQPLDAASARVITDMAGNTVTLPERVERVATVGPVPVLNSLVFAIGKGNCIINGLPDWAKRPRYAYQMVFAPNISALPSMDNHDHTPNLEALLRAAPDVVLTMDQASADSMRRAGLSAVYLAWRQPEDVKEAVRLLGQLFDKPQAAERYAKRFDSTLERIAKILDQNGSPTRPRVLYFNPTTLTQPHLVAEWWIRTAGGESVTDDNRNIESRSFTMEQLLAWDPDILIVSSQEEVAELKREPRFDGLKAVRTGRISVVPCGAHTWGNRTSEQPLTVLWAAKQFHPGLFRNVDVVAETRGFYNDIFEASLSKTQVEEILAGGPHAPQTPASK